MSKRRFALIVAVDQYDDASLDRLAAPTVDAEALAAALGDAELGAFDVDVVVNELSHTIRQRVEAFFVERGPDDLALLHFSCHGLKNDGGELFLAAPDTRPRLLSSTAVDAAFVNRLMRRSRARRAVLLLDCCYGGAFERGLVPRSAGAVDVSAQFDQVGLGGGRGRAVITASSAVQYAFEDTEVVGTPQARPSLFTGALVEGVTTGRADRNHDGRVSLGELYEYVYDRVTEQTPNQTPSKWEYGVEGDLVIARNPRLEVMPGALPAELLDLMYQPMVGSRLGAVHELGRLAAGANLGLAAAARKSLKDMTDDDSKRVSAAAADALEDTKLRLSTSALDLGVVPRADASRQVEVQIEGPPLATASHLTSSIPQAEVHRIDRRIVVEIDTSVAGAIDGTVVITGPAGVATIALSATIVDHGHDATVESSGNGSVAPDGLDKSASGGAETANPLDPLDHASADLKDGDKKSAPRSVASRIIRRLSDRRTTTRHAGEEASSSIVGGTEVLPPESEAIVTRRRRVAEWSKTPIGLIAWGVASVATLFIGVLLYGGTASEPLLDLDRYSVPPDGCTTLRWYTGDDQRAEILAYTQEVWDAGFDDPPFERISDNSSKSAPICPSEGMVYELYVNGEYVENVFLDVVNDASSRADSPVETAVSP